MTSIFSSDVWHGRTSTIKARATCCVYNRQASTSTSSTSASTSDTANSPDRKKAKANPFADVRDYTAPSTGALHATSAAELAELNPYYNCNKT